MEDRAVGVLPVRAGGRFRPYIEKEGETNVISCFLVVNG